MGPGIRAEIRVPASVCCPMARVSSQEETTAHSVSKSVDPMGSNRVTEEFSIESDSIETDQINGHILTTAFQGGSETVYRFTRLTGLNCPCECVEQHGFPVIDVRAERGTLYLIFHVPDQAALREVISTIEDRHPQVEVRRLVQSSEHDEEGSLVFFDKRLLTDRQEEVLERAHREGYFDHPKGANAGEVAERLGITTSTFIEHLSAAQRKLLDSILETDSE